MKFFLKILLFIFITFLFLLDFTYASEWIEVKVSMDLSPMGLHCAAENPTKDTGVFICHIQTGFASISDVLGQIIKYFTFITGLAGVLFIIYNGIMLSMAGLNDGLKAKAKENIQKTILGLILLLLSGLFLNFIAPWVYI